MGSTTAFGRIQTDIPEIRGDINTYEDKTANRAATQYSDAISGKINSLKNDIDTIGGYMPTMTKESSQIDSSLITKRTEVVALNAANRNNNEYFKNSNINKQQEVDTLRGRISNSELVNQSRISIYIIYIFIALVIIGGLISIYWFPSKGRLNIFISIIAVLLLLLTFYQ